MPLLLHLHCSVSTGLCPSVKTHLFNRQSYKRVSSSKTCDSDKMNELFSNQKRKHFYRKNLQRRRIRNKLLC